MRIHSSSGQVLRSSISKDHDQYTEKLEIPRENVSSDFCDVIQTTFDIEDFDESPAVFRSNSLINRRDLRKARSAIGFDGSPTQIVEDLTSKAGRDFCSVVQNMLDVDDLLSDTDDEEENETAQQLDDLYASDSLDEIADSILTWTLQEEDEYHVSIKTDASKHTQYTLKASKDALKILDEPVAVLTQAKQKLNMTSERSL